MVGSWQAQKRTAVNLSDKKIQVYHSTWSILLTNEAWKHASTPRCWFNSSPPPDAVFARLNPSVLPAAPSSHYLHKMINIMVWKIGKQMLPYTLKYLNVILDSQCALVWTVLISAHPAPVYWLRNQKVPVIISSSLSFSQTAAVYGGIKGHADENLLSCNLDKVSMRACAISQPSLPLFILHVTYPNCTLLNRAFIIKKEPAQAA